MPPRPTRRRRTKVEIEKALRRREAARRANLKSRHHMTIEQYDGILAFQGGACAICQRARGKTRSLSVDHDHALARARCEHPHNESCEQCWRGLLCATCNKMLGHARDDIALFIRAIRYLQAPPAFSWAIGED